MPPSRDLTGQRFTRLICLRPTEKRVRGNVVWEAQCDCGVVCEALPVQLERGYKQSCGCLQREVAGRHFFIDGRYLKPTYRSAKSLRDARLRRARKTSQLGLWESDSFIEQQLWLYQEGECSYCRKPLSLFDRDFHLDHMIPLSRGGKHCVTNVCLACPSCNTSKRDRTPEEYEAYREGK